MVTIERIEHMEHNRAANSLYIEILAKATAAGLSKEMARDCAGTVTRSYFLCPSIRESITRAWAPALVVRA